jgi:hypothetical protein
VRRVGFAGDDQRNKRDEEAKRMEYPVGAQRRHVGRSSGRKAEPGIRVKDARHDQAQTVATKQERTYFTSCALWTFLTVPFVLTQPGFETEELEPWGEDGEMWRPLRAVIPMRIASQSADQLFYFGPDGARFRPEYQ